MPKKTFAYMVCVLIFLLFNAFLVFLFYFIIFLWFFGLAFPNINIIHFPHSA